MILTSARLHNFRNHDDTQFEFATAMNVFLGDNGQGKTNILEALSFLCLTKSFYASADVTSLQRGKTFFEVSGKVLVDTEHHYTIRVAFDEPQKQKKFFINNSEVEKFSHVIGQFPVVILSPENNSITFGSPADRRKFIDLIISQSSKSYTEDMLEYKRIVRQRNKFLSEANGIIHDSVLESWNDMLVKYGAKIVVKRSQFIAEFIPFIDETYLQLVGSRETPKIEYLPSFTLPDDLQLGTIKQEMFAKLEQRKKDELRYQTTLVGPHRDEFGFSLNGLQLKNFASQGQHKTFLIALKVAEFFYLKERCNETPIFLLDDVFSELDEERCKKLLSLVGSLGQTFITTTSEKIFDSTIMWNDERRKFFISNGALVKETPAA